MHERVEARHEELPSTRGERHARLAHLHPAELESIERIRQALVIGRAAWPGRSGLVERELHLGVVDLQPLETDALEERPHDDLDEDARRAQLETAAGIAHREAVDDELAAGGIDGGAV